VKKALCFLLLLFTSLTLWSQVNRLRPVSLGESPLQWRHLFVLKEINHFYARDEIPAPGEGPGYYPMAYLRGLYDLPFTGATIGSGTLYLPERGLLEEERLALTSLADRIAGWSGGKRVILLSQIGPFPGGNLLEYRFPDWGNRSEQDLILPFSGGAWRMKARSIEPTWVFARQVQRGETLRYEDFRMTYNQNLESSGWMPSEGGIWKAKGNFTPGQRVSSALLAPYYMINSGEDVRVLVKKGALTVEAQGETHGKGNPGDRVEVSLPWSRKRWQAKILRYGEVEIEIP
jgi:flagella basal body P-ring formation protein FlgA